MADGDHKLEEPSTTSTSIDPIVVTSGGVEAADDQSAKSEESNKQLEFTGDEETLIVRMYNLVGERWSLIAGRIPGRSAEEIEKYWNSRHSTSK